MVTSHDNATFQFSIGDYEYYTGELPEYTTITVSGIHRATIEGNIDKAKLCMQSGMSINEKESQYGYSPLHLAVMCMNVGVLDENFSDLEPYVPYSNANMLKFLLEEKGLDLDSRCSRGWTALYLATSFGDINTVKKLIEAGSDVNASDDDNDRPLHVSVRHRPICDLLLQHGAVICADEKWKTTMQTALDEQSNVDVVHMLLYFNYDANVPDFYGFTPFIAALKNGDIEAQEALLEYVDDFNRVTGNSGRWCGSTLSYALTTNSPFIKDIIERGADVNYADYLEVSNIACAFLACVHYDVDLEAFRMVWERLRFNDAKNTIDFLGFLDYVDEVPAYLSVIIESDNLDVAVRVFSKDDNYFSFVNKYVDIKFDMRQLETLTYRLLEHGFCATSYDIGAVFSYFGDCELFRILRYMDIDSTRGWLPGTAFPRLIFDINFNLESIIDDLETITEENLIRLLEYSICPPLIGALTLRYSEDETVSSVIKSLPRVPSLVELARNAARKQIWHSFKMANTCQFYTAIDHFEMPTLYKDILKFKRKMYITKQ